MARRKRSSSQRSRGMKDTSPKASSGECPPETDPDLQPKKGAEPNEAQVLVMPLSQPLLLAQ